MNLTEKLIEAVIDYGMENCWCDSEIIDTLVGMGITQQDFTDCGYGDFVKEYYAG